MDTSARVPLSITLRKDLLAFAERCAKSREIGSLDEFFDTAVEVFQMRLDAILRNMEAQWLSDEDEIDAVKC